MRSLISIAKILGYVVLTLLVIPLQAIWIVFFNNTKHQYRLVQLYGKLTCLIFAIKIKFTGQIEQHDKLVFVGNHISYIDIITLGSFMNATFIAKSEVAGWPLFGWLARISKTVFITRTREAAPQAILDIKQRILENTSLILFPEATSTQGTSVHPFKSTMFELFLDSDIKDDLIIQPFTISVARVDGKPPQSNNDLDAYAWHGDMTLVPHLWALGKRTSVTLNVIMHPSRPASGYTNRKKFALDCHTDVAGALQTF